MPSSVIRAMRYLPRERTLEIVFRQARGMYRYFDVPLDEWERFANAPSKGIYLNGMFKAKGFRYEKAEAPGRGVLAFAPAAVDDRDAMVRGDESAFPSGAPRKVRPGSAQPYRENEKAA